jgi:hypothetical protein
VRQRGGGESLANSGQGVDDGADFTQNGQRMPPGFRSAGSSTARPARRTLGGALPCQTALRITSSRTFTMRAAQCNGTRDGAALKFYGTCVECAFTTAHLVDERPRSSSRRDGLALMASPL